MAIPAILILSGCVAPYRIVYSSDFSFARYDFIVVQKPDSANTSTSLYGLDIEFANMVARYNMKVIGDKDYKALTVEQQGQTLFARLSMISNNRKDNLISISFDDAASGKTVASVTSRARGDMFDTADRTKALEAVSDALLQALRQDKGLSIKDATATKPTPM